MHEKYQSRISCLLNYELCLVRVPLKKHIDMLVIFLNTIKVNCSTLSNATFCAFCR